MRRHLPIYLNNLDRRPDRLAYMTGQLDRLGLTYERHAAVDATTVSDDELDARTDRRAAWLPFTRESACNVVSHLAMHRRFLETGEPAALILEDDVELAADLVGAVASADWLPRGVGVVQFERYGSGTSKRLVGPVIGEVASTGRAVRMLHSRTGGSACYLITRAAAARIAAMDPRLTTPIDHFLFSPNLSPVFRDLGVALAMPALARQNVGLLSSDIAASRAARKRHRAQRALRAMTEVNRLPRQLVRVAAGARLVPYVFSDRSELKQSSGN